MGIKEFKTFKGSDLTEDQIQEIAEDYISVMTKEGEILVGDESAILEALDKLKRVIRLMGNVSLLVSMLSRQRKVLGMEPYKYRNPII